MDKILKFCGFKKHKYSKIVCEHEPRCEYRTYPGGDHCTKLPPLDMNFFFKYVVPKIEDGVRICFPSLLFDKPTYDISLYTKEKTFSCFNPDPNLSWQEALLKLIGEG